MIFTIKNGNIVEKEAYFDYIMNMKDGVYITKSYIKNRTNDQNRYYRGLLGIVANELGTDSNDIHEKMRMKFLYIPESGKQLAYCKSTAKLTTSEFSEYIEKIKNFMAQFGIILPDADNWENYFNND